MQARFPTSIRPFAIPCLVAALAGFPASAIGDDLASQRERFAAAWAAGERGSDIEWRRLAVGLEGYPLYPYLEYRALTRGDRELQRASVNDFTRRWAGSLPARDLGERWLRQLGKTGDWKALREDWQPTPTRDVICWHLQARQAGGDKPDFASDIEPLWLDARPSAESCLPVFAAERGAGRLPDAVVWQRIDLAAAAGNAATINQAATLLPADHRVTAQRLASSLANPATTLAKAASWPDNPRSRDAISYGLARHARRNSAAAATLWADLQPRFRWDDAQKHRILNALAVYRSTNYSADALARLEALPADAADDVSREWLVRTALAAGDFAATLAALQSMPPAQQSDPRWRYLQARVLTRLKRDSEARPLYEALSREANFFGFLAADWIDVPYSICPLTLPADKSADQAIAKQADLARAFEFHALGRNVEARREWDYALTRLDNDQRQRAADLAYRKHWYDRAVFALSARPETQRMYEQRFPLGQQGRMLREAREAGIDPSWSYGILRAESAWLADARSAADAYGLMQLLPGTARLVANTYGIGFSGRGEALFDPELNIQLGTRYLSMMSKRYDGSPWLASAAYNAGPVPVARWLEARGDFEPDFFIETIPYRETREYVSRVLAFSVIYDWRLNGKVVPLASKLPRIGQRYAPPDQKTPRKAVRCLDDAVPTSVAPTRPGAGTGDKAGSR